MYVKHHSEVYRRRLYLVNNMYVCQSCLKMCYLINYARIIVQPGPALPIQRLHLWLLNCCGLRPQRTMAAVKRVTVTFQMLWPSATMNSGGLAAAKLITKLGKISRNGNTALDRWSKCSARHSSMTSFDPILGWLPFWRAKWISVVVSKEELPTVAIKRAQRK